MLFKIKDEGSRVTIFLSLILAGEAIFFLPFVLARIFRPTLLRVFEITNLELGTYFSVYGVVAMISYFFGGPLADRFPSRNLMAFALWATALGGIVMAMIPSSGLLTLLYGYWGLTTIFLFWAALIRATREWGGTNFQGRAFGLLEGGRGLTAALLGSLALLILSWFSSGANGITEPNNWSFQLVILTISAITFVSGVFIWFVVPIRIIQKNGDNRLPSIKKVGQIFAMPSVWMQALIIVCAYVGYKITDDISLYANQVLGLDEIAAAGVGTAALWMRPVFAVMAGYFADRFNGSKVIIWCFALMILGGILIYLGVLNNLTWLMLTIMATSVIGVYGLRGIYFALMQEASIPLHATGTAVGIMSVVGFTPDVFMSPLMGFLLDSYPGVAGHQYVFLILGLFSVIGLIASLRFRQLVRG